MEAIEAGPIGMLMHYNDSQTCFIFKSQAFVFAYTLTELIYMLFIISSSCEIVSGITEDIIILASVRPQYDKSKKISSVSTVVSQQADPEFNFNTIWPGCVTVQEIKR